MANNTAGNPFIIDTATATAIMSDRFQLLAVQWVSSSTANVCTVQDGGGTTRWECVGSATNTVYSMVSFFGT